MLLAEAYISHRGALLASLQSEYQVGLHDRPLSVMTELVAWLPPGCALWRAFGGPLAWSDETHMLNLLDYRLRVLHWADSEDARKGRNQPEPPKPPPYAGEERAVEAHAERQSAARQKRATRTT